MTTQIAIRLDDRELAALDAEVVEGRAAKRSEASATGPFVSSETSGTAARRPL